MELIVFSIILLLFGGSDAQIILNRRCNENIPLEGNFDIESFVGTWYEIRKSTDVLPKGDCGYIEILNNNGSYTFTNEVVNRNFADSVTGTAILENGTAKFTLDLNGDDDTNGIDFWILETNYNGYSVAYSCRNIDNNTFDQSTVSVWGLTRNKVPTTFQVILISNVLRDVLNIDIEELDTSDHSDDACYVLPIIDQGQPIFLPGQCDPNLPVVQNFSAVDFLGTWHEISSYYSENALGTCARAEYSDGGDRVLVLNSQVINQTLDTIEGYAVLGSDNSGRLYVTLQIAPDVFIEQELLIISTDYTTYAISYVCRNPPNDQKRVYSWILSRTRQLPTSAQIDVSLVIDSILDLNNAYYQQTDQTDDGCFYFPKPSPDRVVEYRGHCDESIPAVPNFNAQAYMGIWHDIESYPAGFQTGDCINARYTLIDNFIEVFNTQVINQSLDTIRGTAVLNTTDGSGKLLVNFPIGGTNSSTESNYWVLATDYTTYSFVYSCSYNPETDTRQIFSWKLSRTKQLTNASNKAINSVMDDIPVLDQQYYISRNQSPNACFYYPKPEQGVPVIFPGQCNTEIAVVQNFNLTNFAGTWYEIEAYPQEFQPGECVRHEYTQSENTLNVQSFAVIGQFLEEISSVVNSTDNNARLTITINTNGQFLTIPFWILATDYDTYALAYSCYNINGDFRAIHSWKLSRTQEVTAVADTTINNYIANANIEVLNNTYFENVDQSDDACFYLPELATGEPVILVGQCDLNINVTQDFQPNRYEGLWHVIEAYPSNFQSGDCNDATYTVQNDGTIRVSNTQVFNQSLDTMAGSASLASNDSSAKLIVTFPNDITFEYWILDTDYSTYSLVYSCMNLPNNMRQVWSWKLSRSRSLSVNANSAINQIINDIQVLNNRYYQVVNNTDEACFYYPEPNGRPVVLRGVCDVNIPVVTDFDASLYMGVWYDIEHYPQFFQQGTCSTASYGLIEEGVNVFNTQVINQTLDSIVGLAVLNSSYPQEAKLTVTFPIAETNNTISSPYWVLSTDYFNYALVYSCQNIPVTTDQPLRSVSSWKLSRQRTLSEASASSINDVINTIPVLRQSYYELQAHTDDDCFYFPEPVVGKPVVFPGQCNNNIPAVPNFDLDRFSGVWYEIESYPIEQQQGQCINYSFNATSNSTMSLVNTQVKNQLLDTVLGSINLVSIDGSARLSVTINSGDSEIVIPYWILATDYENYALAYSCDNINSTFMGVWSWKLSKNKELSADANAAINTAIADINILDQRYYESVSQTDDACFYYPELGPNEQVTFAGQCDPDIPVVQNFDAVQFEGRWFDIESYFDGYEGDCFDGTFTQSGNAFDIRLTQVVNETLDVTISSAAIANDNSGKLIVSTNGVETEYWILETDYIDYALIYSCQNISDNRRWVRTWKMSRTRQLTANASTEIDNIMSTINVLDDQYYITRNHSAESCFYFPVPDPEIPVKFRGRCDDDIPVVQNFSVSNFLGIWHDIESYPTDFQDGTCARTEWSNELNGIIEVTHIQVVEERLHVASGTAVMVSTDNSAKLEVALSILGTNETIITPYWILDTDYNSYALIYSCHEIDEEYKIVNSWKLSRDPTGLNDAANEAINNVISSVPVLRQDYYHDVPQSTEACFFYPPITDGMVYLDGQCPDINDIETVNNFDSNLFSGTWHEMSRFPSELRQGTCATKSLVSTLNTYNFTTSLVVNERLITGSELATLNSDRRGIISTALDGEGDVSVPLDLYVLATDYSEYAVIYSCKNVNNVTKQIYSWLLSRSRDGISQEAITIIEKIVSNNDDLFEDYYETIDQSSDACFYYPDFSEQLPEEIELPGLCNDSISGMPVFDASAYLGRWFEIARYPEPEQTGSCSQVEYSSDTEIIVHNSEVVNQTLLIQSGRAILADDGSGRFTVSYVDNGVTREVDYYVLQTDYTTYSLVYSCRNLDNGNRIVSSWKLSRTQQLSAEANAVINNIIAETQGLLEDYYIQTNQTDEDCFYVPGLDETQPIVFRGQCEDVMGMQGFNMQQFVGWWHEVESYPTGNEGTCRSSRYIVSGSQYQVIDTVVNDIEAQLVTYTVTATADGRLTRRTAEGFEETWIVLATDYEKFALLYHCENINNEYRRVWSAKHSKTAQLTEQAHSIMAPIIEANSVLYPQFYLEEDQSIEGCFYYPPPDGKPVTLRGQCDNDIPVVNQFQIEEYSGRWYQIERYPEEWESGNCSGVQYTVNDSQDKVDVQDWQVVDGELDVIDGNLTAVASVNNEARFIIELPSRRPEDMGIGTISAYLYVLVTDYTSYSLTFSCHNVNSFEQRVAVWKLSRTRTMPATGTVAINQYIATRPELHQRYFEEVGQSEECKEPSSSFVVKSSIIVILVCGIIQLFLK